MDKANSFQPDQRPLSEGTTSFGFDRWRRRRVTIRIAVVLQYAEGGEPVRVPAQTAWVNDEEAMLVLPQELPAGLRVELRLEFTGRRQSGRLTPGPAKNSDGICTAIRFDSPQPGFWHIVFPPPRR